MKVISSDSCEQAWLQAATHLESVKDHSDYNLVVEIARPTFHTAADKAIRQRVDQFLREHKANPVATVAGTIFPSSEYRQYGVKGVYEIYPEETFPEITTSGEWGRYAHRLVRWPTPPGKPQFNPLKTLVTKLKSQLSNGKRLRACYELSLTDSGIDLPLYDPLKDGKRTRGGPCLSHVSIKIGPKNDLYLSAMYRSHSFVARALGNYLGLAALQAFVCEQVDLAPGRLLCLSTYARLDAEDNWSSRQAAELVRAINSEMS